MIAVAANQNSSQLNHQVKEGRTISGGVFEPISSCITNLHMTTRVHSHGVMKKT